MEKALDDALVALYQNGERLRPEQGYPVRLLLPGWEGNMNVKWLRRIKVTDGPTHTKDETSQVHRPAARRQALQFTFEMEVKSVITRPSLGDDAAAARASTRSRGLAWSGAGRIRQRRGVDRRRRDLDARRRCGAGAAEGASYALPPAVGMERRAGACCRAAPPTKRDACSPSAPDLLAPLRGRQRASTTTRIVSWAVGGDGR